MIKKIATIGLITLSLALAGCNNKTIEDNKNPEPEDQNTTSRQETKIDE